MSRRSVTAAEPQPTQSIEIGSLRPRPAAILEKAIPCRQPRRCGYGARRDRTRLPAIVLHALSQSALTAACWMVFAVAWRRWSARQRDIWIKLPKDELAHFEVSRWAQRRALETLARDGLIALRSDGPGQSVQLALHPKLRVALPARTGRRP